MNRKELLGLDQARPADEDRARLIVRPMDPLPMADSAGWDIGVHRHMLALPPRPRPAGAGDPSARGSAAKHALVRVREDNWERLETSVTGPASRTTGSSVRSLPDPLQR